MRHRHTMILLAIAVHIDTCVPFRIANLSMLPDWKTGELPVHAYCPMGWNTRLAARALPTSSRRNFAAPRRDASAQGRRFARNVKPTLFRKLRP